MGIQNPNWPLLCVEANFATGANGSVPTTWYGLSGRVQTFGCSMGKQFELNAVEAGTASGLVWNLDEALSPTNPSSPYNSGGNTLKPFRALRGWAAWPLTGNFLNAGNDVWPLLAGSTGTLADTAGFEGGTVGTWAAVAGAAIANSTTRAHSGTKSLAITWATTAGGAGVAEVRAATVPLKTGQGYVASAWVYVAAGPNVTLSIDGATATSSGTGSWQRLTVAFTAADNAAHGLSVIASAATTSGQQVWVDDVQIELGTTPTAWSSTGPTINPLHSGYIERYPLQWDHNGYAGRVTFTSVDALAILSRVQLPDVLTADQLTDKPVFLWPLWDAQGQIVASNIGLSASSGGVMALAPYGTPTQITTAFGASGSPAVDNQTSLGFAPATPSDTYAPVVDWNGSAGYVLGGNTAGFTIEVWFQANATARTMRVWRLTTTTAGEELALTLNAAGQLVYTHMTSGATIDQTLTSPGIFADGAWHHAVLVTSASGSTVTESVYVDGQQVGSGGRTGTTTPSVAGATLGYDVKAGTNSYAGNLSRFAVYTGQLTATRIQSHWLAGRTAFAGDTADVRCARILAWAGWNGPTNLGTCLTRLGSASGLAGRSAADSLKLAAATENGAVYCAPDGRLTLRSRTAYYAQTASLRTFGESAGTGESPYVSAAAELDPTYVYNIIKVTREGGTTQAIYDQGSISDHGTRSVELSTEHASDDDAAGMGAHLILQYKDAHTRAPQIVLEPSSNPALFAVALGTRFGDRITWKRRTSAGVTIVLDGFVDAIAHSVAPDQWQTTLRVSPVSTYQPGLIGDATYGVVGSTLRYTY